MPAKPRTLLHAALALLSAAGCGGDKQPTPAPVEQAAAVEKAAEPKPAAQPAAPAPAQPAEPAKPDAEGVVHLTSNDQMRYSTTRIEVKAGQKIKIELKNTGALPKEVMGHSLIVLKPGNDVNAFAARALGAKATDYIPPDAADSMLAHTKLLGPGESDTIELELSAATYPFLCTFPGHVGLMNGQLVAQ
jgi:azurin